MPGGEAAWAHRACRVARRAPVSRVGCAFSCLDPRVEERSRRRGLCLCLVLVPPPPPSGRKWSLGKLRLAGGSAPVGHCALRLCDVVVEVVELACVVDVQRDEDSVCLGHAPGQQLQTRRRFAAAASFVASGTSRKQLNHRSNYSRAQVLLIRLIYISACGTRFLMRMARACV